MEKIESEVKSLAITKKLVLSFSSEGLDWIDCLVRECGTLDTWLRYQEYISNDCYIFKSVLKLSDGYYHLKEDGALNPCAIEHGYVEKSVVGRPREVQLMLEARKTFGAFVTIFVQDCFKESDFITGNEIKKFYYQYKCKLAGADIRPRFEPEGAIKLLKQLFVGTRADFDETLFGVGVWISHEMGSTSIRDGNTVYVSCGFSKHSEVLAWFMFLSWFMRRGDKKRSYDEVAADVIDQMAGSKEIPIKLAPGRDYSALYPEVFKSSAAVVVSGLMRRTWPIFNPFVAFRILRYYCIGK